MSSDDSSKFLGPPKVPPVTINSPAVNQEEEKNKQQAQTSNSASLAAPKKLTENVGSATGKSYFQYFYINQKLKIIPFCCYAFFART